MSNTIPIQEWLGFIDSEYLSTFIKDGGASVKFVVTPDEMRSALYGALKARCKELDYIFVELDALTSRVHMPQDIFFALAKHIDWRLLARRMVLRLAEERGFSVEGVDYADATKNVYDTLGRANHIEARFVLQEIRPDVVRKILRNQKMARDFKVAMSHLCTNMDTGEINQPLLDWITGANTRISNVRPFTIRTSINRTTARHYIESALYWVRHVGYGGTVLLLENSRVTLARNPRDGMRYYTRPMTLDHYELLREFIDDVDRLAATLLLVVTNHEFIDSQSKRGWGIYEALQTRVMDDVRDKNLVNPVAALVRLS
ncbi:MAG: DUF2791 family P-loop domain-containing protein [Caldilineaceae bacterium]|nr:DUF2791 family P-loop domain-containing protein [Caldilineaceae bacterium]